ncbi:MAG: hypothetical protein ACK50E_01960 [Bacteroidota bacterium]|jgi:hypothetical protein
MNKLYLSKLQGANSIDKLMHLGRINDETFRFKDTKLDSKIYHTWKMAGLVKMIGDRKWAKFSLVQLLWLMTLESMRRFGCSVKLMKAVYYDLFEKAKKDKLGEKTIRENFEYYKKLSKQRPLTKNEDDIYIFIKGMLKDRLLLYSANSDASYFYQLIFTCLSRNIEVGLIIFQDQSFITYEGWEDVKKCRATPHILIPISSFIKEFIADEEKDQFLLDVGLLSEEGNKIRTLINDRNVQKITISSEKDEDQLVFECNSSGIIADAHAVQIMQKLSLGNYSAIELYTRDGYKHHFIANKPFNNN